MSTSSAREIQGRRLECKHPAVPRKFCQTLRKRDAALMCRPAESTAAAAAVVDEAFGTKVRLFLLPISGQQGAKSSFKMTDEKKR